MQRITNKAFLTGLLGFFIVLSGCALIGQSTANDSQAQGSMHDSRQAESIWVPLREGFALAPLDSPLVAKQVALYSASGTHLRDSLTLAAPYLYFVLSEVKKRNMPAELALLPFLESSFNVRRGKGVNPAGLWGLMPVAARHLNLAQTPFKDERRDVVRSTEAALDLLQELHQKYGDWHIALAAYNWGPGNVSRAISNNQRRKAPITYLNLKMPIETMVFVPKLLALKQIIENPVAYNVTLPEIPNKPFFTAVDVKHTIDISVFTQLAGLSRDEFIDLNPSFNKHYIPADTKQKVLLPVAQVKVFEENYAQFDQPLSAWRSVVIDQEQSLASFAKQWKVDPSRTRQINGMRLGSTLKPGTVVVIPKPSLKDD